MKTTQTDWIGKDVKVVSAPNSTLVGMQGTVINETQELITLETNNGEKIIQKHSVTFQIGNEQFNGDANRVSPAQRMKLKVN